jgi:hypothetical protein
MKHRGTIQSYECKNRTVNITSALQRVEKTNRTIDWGHQPLVWKRNCLITSYVHHTTWHSQGKEMSKWADYMLFMSGIQRIQLLVSSLEISMHYSSLLVAGGHIRRYVDIWAQRDTLGLLTLTSISCFCKLPQMYHFHWPGLSSGKGEGEVWCINGTVYGSGNYIVIK